MDRRFEASELFDVIDHAERYNRHLLDEVLAFAGAARTVLDFGAGTGRLAGALVERGFDVTGVEPDAALRGRLARNGIASVAGFAELGDRRFDYAVSLNVLEHCADDAGVARELHRRLVPGGRCLVYVPAFPALWSANDDRVGHQRRYRRRPLLRLFRDAGFAVTDVRHVDSLGFLAALAYRFVGRADGELTAASVRRYDRWLFPASRVLDRALHPVLGKNLLLRAERR
jgi:SAM-dependent methyltransferase